MKTEKILIGFMLSGILFKIFHLYGSVLILAPSTTALALLYFPFAFYFFRDKTFKHQNLVLSILTGWNICLAPLGVLFKFCRWPGANQMLLLCLVTLPIFIVIIYFFKRKAKEELDYYYKTMLARVIFWFALTLIISLIPHSVIRNLVPVSLGQARDEYLSDTTDIEAKLEYEKCLMKQNGTKHD